MSYHDLKETAKQKLTGNWGMAILVFVLVYVVMNSLGGSTVVLLVVLNPVYIGLSRFHIRLQNNEKGQVEDLFIAFKDNYGDHLVTMLLRTVFVFLWTLLLIIPGIIKGLAYTLVPYILQDERYNVTGMDALATSEELMKGHKMELFGLYLSFILWFIFVLVTFGLGLLYVGPYMNQTIAGFYANLTKQVPYKSTSKTETIFYE